MSTSKTHTDLKSRISNYKKLKFLQRFRADVISDFDLFKSFEKYDLTDEYSTIVCFVDALIDDYYSKVNLK